MKHGLRFFSSVLAIVLVVAVGESYAQGGAATPLAPAAAPPRIYIGPIGGFNQDFHSGGFRSFKGDPVCPVFEAASATGFFVGGSFEYLLGNPSEATSSILLRLAYDSRPVSFAVREEGTSTLPVIDTNRVEIVDVTTEHRAQINYSLLSLDALYKIMISRDVPLGIAAGVTANFVLVGQAKQTYEIIAPNNAQFDTTKRTDAVLRYEDNAQVMVFVDGDIPNRSSFRFGIKAGLFFELNLRKFLFAPALVVPGIWFDAGLTKVTTAENWRVNAFQAGVDIRWAL